MREHMTMKMIDIHNRNTQPEGKTLGERCANMKRAEKSRSASECYSRQVVLIDTGTFEGSVHHRHNVLLMSPRSKLRHNTTIFGMNILRCYYIAEQHAVADNCCRSIVTRRFDS